MESKGLYALIVLILATKTIGISVESIDILKPIIKRSPDQQNQNDLFGFSFAVHQLFSDSSGLSGEDAMDQTVIMIGAPRGQFPGGLTGIAPNGLACRANRSDFTQNDIFEDDAVLEALPEAEVWPCYEGRKWGLVYQCSLNDVNCSAALGDGDALSPDGLLFDRVGNTQSNAASIGIATVFQFKDDQLMGFSLYSTGEYFVACAPGWERGRFDTRTISPRGRCVYSNRTLSGFKRLIPCVGQGSPLNQLSGGEGYCHSGVGVTIDAVEPKLWVGSPGRLLSSGAIGEYNDLNTASDVEGDFGIYYVPPTGTANNIEMNSHWYLGYYLTTGSMTAVDSQNLIASAVRATELNATGRVEVYDGTPITGNGNTPTPVLSVEGEQFGDYFGNSVVAVDLNGDGFDDLVVGAPFYSEFEKAEIGQVYVYRNDGGTALIESVTMSREIPSSRFGYSIAGLGDLNNDGYEDFAVSAPYEGSGAVYIYYGQQMDSDGSIVDTEPKQVIRGDTFGVESFGSTIQALVDIDLNKYRDLVVAAVESRAVVTLRTRPVALITTTLSSVPEVSLDEPCSMTESSPCFNVTVCASFIGRSISNLTAQYTVAEFGMPTRRRLFFRNNDGEQVSSLPGSLSFMAENVTSCKDFTVYVQDTSGRNIDDFVVQFEFEQTEETEEDSLTTPELDSSLETVNVAVAADCGTNGICNSDLFVRILNVVYLLNGVNQNQTTLILNSFDTIRVDLQYGNRYEQAISANISFTVPTFLEYSSISSGIRCGTNVTDAGTNVTCDITGTVNTAPSADVSIELRPRTAGLIGNEPDVPISFDVQIMPQTRNVENMVNTSDNTADIVIDIVAKSVINVQSGFAVNVIDYNGGFRPEVAQASDLGEALSMFAEVVNSGPSTILNATINIYIPAASEETGEYFYYYPASLAPLTTDVATVTCEQNVLNPDDLALNKKRRRRRSERTLYSHIAGGLSRMVRQDESFTLDCQVNRDACILLNCSVSNFIPGSILLNINGYLDERFYYLKDDQYTLRTFTDVVVLNDFIDTTESTTSDSGSITIATEGRSPGTDVTPLVLSIVLPIIGSMIFIGVLGFVLYCFGFFRRKKHGQEDTNEEFEAFDENAFSSKAAAASQQQEKAKEASGTTL